MNKKMTLFELVDALQNKYTLSIRDICQMLKCSRTWVNQYITHALDDRIFLTNIDDGTDNKVNWASVVSKFLGRKIIDSVWFNTDDFFELMLDSMCSFSVQTKKIPIEKCVVDPKKFVVEYTELLKEFEEIKKTYSIPLMNEHLKKMKSFVEENLSIDGRMVYDSRLKTNKRSAVPRHELAKISKEELERIIHRMKAPHDMKDYGDTDELIYRKFFKNGFYRIEFNLVDADGNVSKKIYYLEPEQEESTTGMYITIPYEVYMMCYSTDKENLYV